MNVLEVLGAHVVVDAVLMLFVMVITLVCMCGFLQFENNGPLWVLALLNVLNGFSGMFQGECQAGQARSPALRIALRALRL